jgi:hypothetical protein
MRGKRREEHQLRRLGTRINPSPRNSVGTATNEGEGACATRLHFLRDSSRRFIVDRAI